MARKIRIDMTRLRYGRLVGIDFSHSSGGHAHWRFVCDCGNETIADGTAVRAGKTASCGCLHREICADRLLKHGRRAKKRHDATYRAWQEINCFCTNADSPRFRDFGARGIAVCSAWRADFETFLSDMGERPRNMMLARIDQAGDFTPVNCRWVEMRSRAQRAIDGARRRSESSRESAFASFYPQRPVAPESVRRAGQ
jgi:hypothetical protein